MNTRRKMKIRRHKLGIHLNTESSQHTNLLDMKEHTSLKYQLLFQQLKEGRKQHI